MIPNPIHKVLSTLSSHAVRHLLMGGQACVFYGAAEFSCDSEMTAVRPTIPSGGRAAFKLLGRRKLQHGHSGHSFNPQPSGEGELPFVLAWRLWVKRTSPDGCGLNEPRLAAAG